MSAPGSPGRPGKPAAGVFPNLEGQGLPRALTNGIQQGFSMVYSLRDTVNQQASTISKLLQYATHLNRINTNAEAMPDCMLWFESDRQTAFYQTRLAASQTTRDWFYAGGIYADVLANRPTDLGKNDLGFLFLALDYLGLYRWNGTSWDTV